MFTELYSVLRGFEVNTRGFPKPSVFRPSPGVTPARFCWCLCLLCGFLENPHQQTKERGGNFFLPQPLLKSFSKTEMVDT
jgi:hypothetical protein